MTGQSGLPVTGGKPGIGVATCKLAGERGLRRGGNYRNDRKAAEEVVVRAGGGDAGCACVFVAAPYDVAAAFASHADA